MARLGAARQRPALASKHVRQQPHVGLTKLNMNNQITHDELLKLLSYSEDTGHFTWIENRRSNILAGNRAGHITCYGYRIITAMGVRYQAHRLAWFYVNGAWPINDIDHIDRNRDNNSIGNLRQATRSENMRNTVAYSSNKLGAKGVHLDKKCNKFRVQIRIHGKLKHIGLFTTLEAAKSAYETAATLIHGKFSRAI